MITHIHHINFLVKDLNEGIHRYQKLLCLGDFIVDDLPGRSVKTARIKLGDCWLVLVQPVSDEGIPAQHLREHGEGFFLISYGTDGLEKHMNDLSSRNLEPKMSPLRKGLDNWQIIDFPIEDFFGTQVQLAEELGDST